MRRRNPPGVGFLATVCVLCAWAGASPAEVPAGARASQGVTLGPEVTDREGRTGRLHRVVPGDTLWDISEAYLGTAWVWPSVWHENADITNPHRIFPGDIIWISRTAMRVLDPDEGAALWAAARARPQRSAARTPRASGAGLAPQLRRAASGFGFVSEEDFEAASSIVDSPEERTWLAAGDEVYIGLGQGQVARGDQFRIFREPLPVRDFESGRRIGFYVEVVGRLAVQEPGESSSRARILESNAEIARGDRLARGHDENRWSEPSSGPPAVVAGHIVFIPPLRSLIGTRDAVTLDRGRSHGLRRGDRLEVYLEGSPKRDRVSGATVHTPDHVLAELVVVELDEEVAIAVVFDTRRALRVGDAFRTRPAPVLARRGSDRAQR